MKTLSQRRAGTTCSRCGEQRWPFKDWVDPYTCSRCQEVVRGGHALDPVTERSPAQQAVTQALRRRRRTGISLVNKGG